MWSADSSVRAARACSDCAIHHSTVTGRKQFADNNPLQLEHTALQQLQLMPAEGTDAYQPGTDYTASLATGQITRLATGTIPANSEALAAVARTPRQWTVGELYELLTILRREGLGGYQKRYFSLTAWTVERSAA